MGFRPAGITIAALRWDAWGQPDTEPLGNTVWGCSPPVPHSMVMIEQGHASLHSSNIPVLALYTVCNVPSLGLSPIPMCCAQPLPHTQWVASSPKRCPCCFMPMLSAVGGHPTEPFCPPVETHRLSHLHAAPISNPLPLHPYRQHWEMLPSPHPPPLRYLSPQHSLWLSVRGRGVGSSRPPAALLQPSTACCCFYGAAAPGGGPRSPAQPLLPPHTRLRAQPCTLPSRSLAPRQSNFWGGQSMG